MTTTRRSFFRSALGAALAVLGSAYGPWLGDDDAFDIDAKDVARWFDIPPRYLRLSVPNGFQRVYKAKELPGPDSDEHWEVLTVTNADGTQRHFGLEGLIDEGGWGSESLQPPIL